MNAVDARDSRTALSSLSSHEEGGGASVRLLVEQPLPRSGRLPAR